MRLCRTERKWRDSIFEFEFKENTIIGNYNFRVKIGGGGYGMVYFVRHIKTGVAYAAKVILNPDPNPNPPNRNHPTAAMREVSNQRQLGLPITEVFHYGIYPIIIMEYIDQVPQKCIVLGSQVETILDFASFMISFLVKCKNMRMIHGDLSANNFMWCSRNRKRFEVIDFGTSTYIPPCYCLNKITFILDNMCTTLPYRCPRILYQVDPFRYDLWSFGVIVYELWFRNYPFVGNNPSGGLTKVQCTELVSILPRTCGHPILQHILSTCFRPKASRVEELQYYCHSTPSVQMPRLVPCPSSKQVESTIADSELTEPVIPT